MLKEYRKSFGFVLGVFSLCCICLVLFSVYLSTLMKPEKQVARLEKGMNRVQMQVDTDVEYIKQALVKGGFDQAFYNRLTHESIAYYIYDRSELLFWSDNTPALNESTIFNFSSDTVLVLNNGVYYYTYEAFDDFRVGSLIQLKKQFPYQNEFLKNEVCIAENVSQTVQFNQKDEGFPIYGSNEGAIFYVNGVEDGVVNSGYKTVLFFLYILLFVLLLRLIQMLYDRFGVLLRFPILKFLIFVIDIIIVRLLVYFLPIHSIIGVDQFFYADIYSGFFLFNSFGDLILNSIVLLFISYGFFKIRDDFKLNRYSSLLRIFLSFCLIVFLFLSSFSYGVLLIDMVLNSEISFELANISKLNVFSIIAFVVISSYALSLFFFLYVLCFVLAESSITYKEFYIGVLVLFVVSLFIVHDYLLVICLLFASIVNSLFFLLIRKKYDLNNIGFVILSMILFAIFSTYILTHVISKREKLEREQFAIRISESRDKIAEYKFEPLIAKISKDDFVKSKIDELDIDRNAEGLLDVYLKNEYFLGFWSKYNVQFTICSDQTELNIQNENIIINCQKYFNEVKGAYGKSTICENLYYLDNFLEEANYLAEVLIVSDLGKQVMLYIDITPQITHETLGYPELLIDESSRIDRIINNDYSYAIYVNNKLLKSVGKFKYTLDLQKEFLEKDEYYYGTSERYEHLFIKVNKEKTIVVSKSKPDILAAISPYSYMLLIFGLFLVLFLFVSNVSLRNIFVVVNFRKQIQTSIISIIIISFFFIGVVSLFSIQDLHRNKNVEVLNEKAHSVLIELEHKLSDRQELTTDMSDYLTRLLIKFSQVFFSDLNLYDLKGNLLASSRPQIFEEGLISRKMDTQAYIEMATNKKTLYIQNEKLGSYEFISAYIPFVNQENELIAYLNLPYFAKQTELTEEVSVFLVAFINIYILLTVISIIIGILVSNYVTRPLMLIKGQLSKVEFGKENLKLDWETNDEIGSLVKEYNRMIDELEQSAELLAKSERESAWREMAKQVAHEIKNPLTPMKLSVQYLMRAWDDNADDLDERLKRFSNTMIEQIDSLSAIASAFSDFAKMPKSEMSVLDLVDSISGTIGIYNDVPNVNIFFKNYRKGHFIVYADKKQMLSVFNNLIKNAIQAIPDGRVGEIHINLEYFENDIIISIKDTGIGIQDHEKDKIFYPNFTTKTSGMGLGLSMVKSIIKSAGGDIWFETEINNGTIFFIRIPKYVE